MTHGLAESAAQFESESAEFKQQGAEFIDDLVSHYVLDEGKLVVAHAGMRAEMQGEDRARSGTLPFTVKPRGDRRVWLAGSDRLGGGLSRPSLGGLWPYTCV